MSIVVVVFVVAVVVVVVVVVLLLLLLKIVNNTHAFIDLIQFLSITQELPFLAAAPIGDEVL